MAGMRRGCASRTAGSARACACTPSWSCMRMFVPPAAAPSYSPVPPVPPHPRARSHGVRIDSAAQTSAWPESHLRQPVSAVAALVRRVCLCQFDRVLARFAAFIAMHRLACMLRHLLSGRPWSWRCSRATLTWRRQALTLPALPLQRAHTATAVRALMRRRSRKQALQAEKGLPRGLSGRVGLGYGWRADVAVWCENGCGRSTRTCPMTRTHGGRRCGFESQSETRSADTAARKQTHTHEEPDGHAPMHR